MLFVPSLFMLIQAVTALITAVLAVSIKIRHMRGIDLLLDKYKSPSSPVRFGSVGLAVHRLEYEHSGRQNLPTPLSSFFLIFLDPILSLSCNAVIHLP
jgi:hypothetical protein